MNWKHVGSTLAIFVAADLGYCYGNLERATKQDDQGSIIGATLVRGDNRALCVDLNGVILIPDSVGPHHPPYTLRLERSDSTFQYLSLGRGDASGCEQKQLWKFYTRQP